MVAIPVPIELVEPSDEAFLAEVRQFLDKALTPDLREASRRTIGVYTGVEHSLIWYRRLHARGWIAPAWPIAYGGADWSARMHYLWDRECALNDAPVLYATAIRSLGPLLIEMGSPAQRARFLLIDMTRPGITVSPIRDIAGQVELNQVFFDGVRVPVADRVGGENEGWAVGHAGD